MDFFKRHRVGIILLALALLARVAFLGAGLAAHDGNLTATIYGGDYYYQISQNIVAGNGFSAHTEPPYIPNTLRTAGYIYFIAIVLLITKSYWAVIMLQILLSACTVLLARRVSFAIIPNEKIALWCGILMALNPYVIYLSTIFLTETFFVFFFLLYMLGFLSYLERPRLSVLCWSALALGVCILTKPTVEYLPILTAGLIVYRFGFPQLKRSLVHGAIMLCIAGAVVAPWIYRNYSEFGAVALSTQPAYNLYTYFVPSVLSLERGESFNTEFLNFSTPEERRGDAITFANSPAYNHKALAIITQHPKGVLLSIGTTMITFFTTDGLLSVLQQVGLNPSFLLAKPALSLL
ncbi:MAG: glycosyltransferase family 39 protein, partial [Minisyncoccia bacterium]